MRDASILAAQLLYGVAHMKKFKLQMLGTLLILVQHMFQENQIR
jgi:hypothetical protein